MVIREAHYGRHSSDMQNPRSTKDQLQALRIISEACGKASIRTFADEAVSGSALTNRPGLQALLAAVARGEIDKVRAESLDRLSRDQEGIAQEPAEALSLASKTASAAAAGAMVTTWPRRAS